ncbi:MAG TPA: right-handed parallel beta-helix repeat-containing protein, partial [bacterium]|nr:right-handed parallel beta-helix repeat-containing protein [bacterium]
MSFQQRRRIPWLGCVLACVLAGGVPAAAETTYHVPGDFETISAAMDSAQSGDVILVGPGTYQESLLFSESSGSGLIVRSTEGSGATTVSYGEEGNVNEAVVTFQRCSNSTQFIGFSIDGRGVARRGILTNSDSKPVLVDIRVNGCEYGIAAHRGSRPFVRDVRTANSVTAGLFISGGSMDVKDSQVTSSEKFGVYIGNASEPVRLRNVTVNGNGQVGLQA